MANKNNSINWFAIPVTDFQRAVKFYNTILGSELFVTQMAQSELAFFPCEPGEVGGHLFKAEPFKPSANGALLYLNGGDDLQPILDRVEGAGGKVVGPKRQVTPEIGYVAEFIDSEGNKVALHSKN